MFAEQYIREMLILFTSPSAVTWSVHTWDYLQRDWLLYASHPTLCKQSLYSRQMAQGDATMATT